MKNLPNGSIIAFEMGYKALTAKITGQNDNTYLVEVIKESRPWSLGNELFIKKNDATLILVKEYVAPVEPVKSTVDTVVEEYVPAPFEIQQTEWYKMFFGWWR